MIYNKSNFRIVFMGTPDFAVASLRAIIEHGFNVVGVVTAPDKPAGRGKKISESAVKKYAAENNLNLLQPTNLKDSIFLTELKNLDAHLQIIVAFRMLPRMVWDMPPLGSVNLHASLLPMYRGAAPINWALINGEKETGVSTFFLKHEIDTGDILFQKKISIAKNDNVGKVHDKLMSIGAMLLVKTVDAVMTGNYKEIPQSKLIDNELKEAPKIFKSDCKVNWQLPLFNIHNLIRGLSPYPCSWSELIDRNTKQKHSIKLFESEAIEENHKLAVGTLLSDKKTFLKVAVVGGFINILELQIAGKKRMTIQSFLQGFQHIDNYQVV